MSSQTTIEWTQATWNPVTGCSKVSPGYAHCYAETFAERFRGVEGHHFQQGFDVRLWPERLELPIRWRRPRRVFVNSLSDLFLPEIPGWFLARVWATMQRADWHDLSGPHQAPGADAPAAPRPRAAGPAVGERVGWDVNRKPPVRAPRRSSAPHARRRAVISAEPLLGPLDNLDLTGIGWLWLIAGGESGPPGWSWIGRAACATAARPRGSRSSTSRVAAHGRGCTANWMAAPGSSCPPPPALSP